MIISAYEGVIKRRNRKLSLMRDIDVYRNVHAINKYVKAGNDFMVTTRRKPGYIRGEIEKYKMLYTYLSVYNGLVTYDKRGNVVNAEYIDEDKVREMLKIIDHHKVSNHVRFYDERGLKQDDKLDNVVMVDFNIYNMTDVLKSMKDLDLGYTYSSSGIAFIKDITKKESLEKVLETINCHDVKLISDYSSDVPLFEHWDGYVVSGGSAERYVTNGKSTSLQKLLKKEMGK